MVDDDLDMNALTKTNYVKSIVTAELRMDLERKKEQSYQGLLYVRFLCFGNGALTALHDRSDRFATVFLQFCKNWNMSQKQDAFVSIVPRRKTGFLPNTGKNGNRSPWGE